MEEQNRQNGTETQVQTVRYRAERETLDKNIQRQTRNEKRPGGPRKTRK